MEILHSEKLIIHQGFGDDSDSEEESDTDIDEGDSEGDDFEELSSDYFDDDDDTEKTDEFSGVSYREDPGQLAYNKSVLENPQSFKDEFPVKNTLLCTASDLERNQDNVSMFLSEGSCKEVFMNLLEVFDFNPVIENGVFRIFRALGYNQQTFTTEQRSIIKVECTKRLGDSMKKPLGRDLTQLCYLLLPTSLVREMLEGEERA